ncbi:MAG: glutamate--tRNA ligase [Thermoplasmata archaeon]|nr:glutamate--tRNA ligase [Thermoplasmata archaeon]
MLSPDSARRARRLALQNAVAHGGSPRPGPIAARLLADEPALRPHAAEVQQEVATIVTEVAGLGADAQRAALDALGGAETPSARRAESDHASLPPLDGADRAPVVLRMAPFPSGSLHIGNARMIYINDYYRTLHHGRLLLVFDDTVGSEEKRIDPEMFDVQRRDLELAGVAVDATYFKSDRVAGFYPWARRVIERGAAYVCVCPAELLRANRAEGRACPQRSQTLEQTLDGWEGMLGGRYAPGEAVLRLKTDIADPDPAFRDRVLCRISDFDHPRVGRKFRVWPLLEFSWAVDDVELGISHVIRGKDLVMEDRMESYLWKVLGLTGPRFVHWGLLRVREAKISKSKSYQEVKSGLYDGWADPRTWSIASLDRRGITAQALRRFTLSFGISLADIEVPAETLYAENRQAVDASTPRRSFVADPIRLRLRGSPPELSDATLANHPDHPELGTRQVTAGPEFWLARRDVEPHLGEEVRLKDLLNVRLPPALGSAASAEVEAEFTSRENRRLPRLQWVGAVGAVPVDLLGLEGEHTHGLGESALAAAAPGDRFQFERVGFVRVESDWVPGTAPVRVCFGHP